jgi:hypothetical protein
MYCLDVRAMLLSVTPLNHNQKFDAGPEAAVVGVLGLKGSDFESLGFAT